MRIAVISDTHSRAASVRNALAIMMKEDVEAIVHCGDIQDGETVRLFPAYAHFVFGNCDYDRDEIEAGVNAIGATLHGAWGHLDFSGHSLAFTHGDNPQLLQDLEYADTFDFLFHGHTHIAREHRTGKTRVINPGALQRVARPSFLILDLPEGNAKFVEL